MVSQACLYDQALIKTASLVAYSVKNLPVMQETWVLFLTLEDPLEKEMATHSGIRAWRIPQTEEPSRLQSMGSQQLDTTNTKVDNTPCILSHIITDRSLYCL